ncbi:MAG: major Facilitator Superfamily protein [Bacillales bacterium]|jgi:MFS family permease|nr:major Facilitator Superfamily protein [Bacillales bacterium]
MNKQESSYRWVVFYTTLFAYFIIVSQRTAPGLITNQLINEFNVSASTIGFMAGIQFFAYAGLQIPIGLLSDRYGPNRFLIIGTLLNGVGSVIYSSAPNEYVLIFSRFLVGIGDATIYVNLVLILSQWFKIIEFVKLLGIISLASSLGSLSATVPFSTWISFVGWRTPFLSVGITLILLSYLLYIVLIKKAKQIFKDDVVTDEQSNEPRENFLNILRRVISKRQAWATLICHFGIVGTYFGFIGSWGVPYGMHVFGLSRSDASQLMMYGLFGAIIGGPLTSWISSRFGSIKKIYSLTHLMVFCSWLGLFLLGVNPSFNMVVVFLFIIGFGSGASALTFAVVRKSFPIKEVGVVSGFSNTGGFLSAFLLPIAFGNLIDAFPKDSIEIAFHYAFIIPSIFSFVGFIGVNMIKEKSRKYDPTS